MHSLKVDLQPTYQEKKCPEITWLWIMLSMCINIAPLTISLIVLANPQLSPLSVLNLSGVILHFEALRKASRPLSGKMSTSPHTQNTVSNSTGVGSSCQPETSRLRTASPQCLPPCQASPLHAISDSYRAPRGRWRSSSLPLTLLAQNLGSCTEQDWSLRRNAGATTGGLFPAALSQTR